MNNKKITLTAIEACKASLQYFNHLERCLIYEDIKQQIMEKIDKRAKFGFFDCEYIHTNNIDTTSQPRKNTFDFKVLSLIQTELEEEGFECELKGKYTLVLSISWKNKLNKEIIKKSLTFEL